MGIIKKIALIIIGGFAFVLSFYPLDIWLPEAYWPLLPDILVHYPLMFILNQLIPSIFWISTFLIGVFLIRGLINS